MRFWRRLSSRGPRVSAIGLGCNTLGTNVHGAEAIAVVHRALDHGINFFDTADMYGDGRSEELLGEALRGRDGVVVATKCGARERLDRSHIRSSCLASLVRLRRDAIDLLQVHRWDPEVPLADTLGALAELCDEGLIRWFGVSNFDAEQIRLAWTLSDPRLVSVQNKWNLIDGADPPELPVISRELGIGVIPYSPLASGILSGKYRHGVKPPSGTRAAESPRMAARLTPKRLDAVARAENWAAQRGLTVANVAIAWLLAFDCVSTVIVGTRSPAQVDHAVAALDIELDPEQRDAVRIEASHHQ